MSTPYHTPDLLKKLATPLAMTSFMVIAVSGLMLFFHLGERFVKELHEWLGIIFVMAAILHVYRNGGLFKKYFQDRLLWRTLALTLMLVLTFVLPAGLSGQRHDLRSLVEAVANAPLQHVAPVLGTSYENMRLKFAQHGIAMESPSISLREVAHHSKRPLPEILSIAMP